MRRIAITFIFKAHRISGNPVFYFPVVSKAVQSTPYALVGSTPGKQYGFPNKNHRLIATLNSNHLGYS